MVSALNIIGSDKSLQEHWIKRLVAIIIDLILVQVIVSIVLFLLNIDQFKMTFEVWSIRSLLFGLILFFYSSIMEAMPDGATIGKRVLNLRTMSINDEEMDISKSVIRNLSKINELFFVLDSIIGFITDGEPKQRWLDRIAGTTVVVTTALGPDDQHLYQTQQAKYAPPPQEQYVPRHDQVYQYPPPSASAQQKPGAPSQQPQPAAQKPVEGVACAHCGGRMAETGSGRLQCIRCGKIL